MKKCLGNIKFIELIWSFMEKLPAAFESLILS